MDSYFGKKYIGEFYINSKKYNGELFFNGLETQLEIWSDKPISTKFEQDNESNVNGLIYDGMKIVTLVNSIVLNNGTSNLRQGDGYVTKYRTVIHPRVVLIGDSEFEESKGISEIYLQTYNLGKVFYDYKSLTRIIHPDVNTINSLIERDRAISKDKFGFDYDIEEHILTESGKDSVHPSIYIYNGAKDIFNTETELGNISLFHFESSSQSGGNGINVDISTQFRICCNKGINISDVISESWKLLNFVKFISGQEDAISHLRITVGEPEEHKLFDVYVSTDRFEPIDSHFDGLLSTLDSQEYISSIVSKWMARHGDWKDSRNQLSISYSSNNYNIDRVVRSANIFDLIPVHNKNSNKVLLSDDILKAKQQAREIFRSLPDSLERNSILNAIGRIGTKTLKHKIRDRIDLIEKKSDVTLNDIRLVAEQAVDCRNYFVHGGKKNFEYESEFGCINFFIDTLEFIFVVSDLIECGWDMDKWIKSDRTNHKVGNYLYSYEYHINELKTVLGK